MVANHPRRGVGAGLDPLIAECLRGVLDRGLVCSHPGIEIVSTYIEVQLVELFYVTTNASFNFGKFANSKKKKKKYVY